MSANKWSMGNNLAIRLRSMLTLADLLEALTGVRPTQADQIITEATVDSRQAIPGSLFVAMRGEHHDGHDFVQAAFKRGSTLALVERDLSSQIPVVDLRRDFDPEAVAAMEGSFCLRVPNTLQALQQVAQSWRRKLNVRVIGITGSVGKSTTKELIAEVLGQRYRTLKNPGNLNNEIGLPLTLLSLSEGHERAVLEMGFYVPGEIETLCKIALPQVGVVTNIGTVHAERAGSLEAIAQGKTELVQSLPPEGWAILNYDDPFVREMSDKTRAHVFFYGLDPQANLWADNIDSLGLDGIRFEMHYRGEILHMHVPMIGRHSVQTVLRAAAVGLVEGLTWQEIIEGLRSTTTQLRLVAMRTQSGALILDDTYNASPDSTLAALTLLGELEGYRLAVLGDMLELGPYEQQGHEMVGARVADIVDELVTVGERARIIARSARQAGLQKQAITEFEDVQKVAEYLQQRLTPEHVVLIKGSRGMHMDRIVTALESVA
jgi:UDP-N-acetylmuramoyl-tripeptide--D-alanyl-D-alanine ligase